MGVSQYNKVTCLCILYCYNFNPLQPSVAFLYHLKIENLKIFCFQGVYKRFSDVFGGGGGIEKQHRAVMG